MTGTKRCSGIDGVWACVEDYPDHILPIDKFGLNRGKSTGRQQLCRECKKIYNKSNNAYNNAVIREACIISGLSSNSIRTIPSEDRISFRRQARLNLENSPDKNVVEITPQLKSEFGQSTPMTKRETVRVGGETVPEGWVYVVRNPDVPWALKIGKTFPNGIPDIMSSARRFGRSELVDKFWFEEAYKAEQSIHALLKHCNLRTLGHTDCGTELFKCTIEEAMDAITKVQSENDRPSVAVGG